MGHSLSSSTPYGGFGGDGFGGDGFGGGGFGGDGCDTGGPRFRNRDTIP